MLEGLEARALLAVTAQFASGLLTVAGTRGSDRITVLVAPLNLVTVKSGGTQIYSSASNGDVVTGISVIGGKGNDRIDVNNNESSYAITVSGDDGNDTITSNSAHAPGAVITGGAGDDSITATNALFSGNGAGASLNGNDGNDVLRSTDAMSSAGSTLSGGDGNDELIANTQGITSAGVVEHGGKRQRHAARHWLARLPARLRTATTACWWRWR
jgi:hypothetical protein